MGAFAVCTSLLEILIPHTVKAIKGSALLRCSQLTRVILGEQLEEIGKMTFYECTSLHEILIPSVVKVIMHDAFYQCS